MQLPEILFSTVTPEQCRTTMNSVGRTNLFIVVFITFSQRNCGCFSLLAVYAAKNHELLKTGLNNVLLPYCSRLSTILFSIVTPDCGLDSGSTTCSVLLRTLSNVGSTTLHVQSCFQLQPSTPRNFDAFMWNTGCRLSLPTAGNLTNMTLCTL